MVPPTLGDAPKEATNPWGHLYGGHRPLGTVPTPTGDTAVPPPPPHPPFPPLLTLREAQPVPLQLPEADLVGDGGGQHGALWGYGAQCGVGGGPLRGGSLPNFGVVPPPMLTCLAMMGCARVRRKWMIWGAGGGKERGVLMGDPKTPWVTPIRYGSPQRPISQHSKPYGAKQNPCGAP